MLAATRTSTSKAAFKVATASSTRSLSVTACRMQRPSTPPPQQPHKPAHLSPLSPSAPPQRVGGYSPLTVSLVKGLAKLMGYNSKTSTAIRVTSDLYDLAAQQSHFDEHFWHNGEYIQRCIIHSSLTPYHLHRVWTATHLPNMVPSHQLARLPAAGTLPSTAAKRRSGLLAGAHESLLHRCRVTHAQSIWRAN